MKRKDRNRIWLAIIFNAISTILVALALVKHVLNS